LGNIALLHYADTTVALNPVDEVESCEIMTTVPVGAVASES
jgi:hypothetical protein